MSNAQLDNEKQTYRFQVDLLKDQMDDLEEQLLEVQREHHDRCKVSDRVKVVTRSVVGSGKCHCEIGGGLRSL